MIRRHLKAHRRAYTRGGAAAGMTAAALLGLAGGQLAGHHRPPAHPSPPVATPSDQGAPIGHCGVERWPVKTGTDADASQVVLSPVPTTIAHLTSLPAPSNPPNDRRVAPTETTVFTLMATITEFKLETDNDYHVVVSDGARTMIVELANPGCVGAASPFRTQISHARAQFDARYVATGNFQSVSVPVTVTGIAFFDRLHHQMGVAPNGIELHPVLDIQFR